MKVASVLLFGLLSRANAVGSSSLRGDAAAKEDSLGQFACTLKGGQSQSTCDSSKSEDGSQCVWCALATFGVCVSDDIASQMEQNIPGIDCDDKGGSDDDAPAPDEDDDAAPQDDDVPPDYWTCLEKYAGSKDCTDAGCAWCENKGGYGVCMDKEQAESFDDTDWYTCTIPSLPFANEETIPGKEPIGIFADPSDTTCLLATLMGDEAVCKGTTDSEGKACDWCSFQGYDFCLNDDQAEIAEQYGASCDEQDESIPGKEDNVVDPSDTTCLLATLTGDESACKGTTDSEGKSCDWCSVQGYDFCLDDDQAEIAEQLGGSCSEQDESIPGKEDNVVDPSDNTCLLATLTGDEVACKGTMDSEGKPCDWCSLQGFDFCMDDDQAKIAEQLGASCSEGKSLDVATDALSDPSDPSCLFITINGDESACRGSTDVDGKACEWCSFQSYEFCLNVDQADIVEQYGVTCNEEAPVDDAKKDLSDPMDTQCLGATVGGDESQCEAAMDSSGKPCEWCKFQSYAFCLNVDQAQLVEQYGAECGDDRDSEAKDISTSVA